MGESGEAAWAGQWKIRRVRKAIFYEGMQRDRGGEAGDAWITPFLVRLSGAMRVNGVRGGYPNMWDIASTRSWM